MERAKLIENLKALLSDEWKADDWVDSTEEQLMEAIIGLAFFYQKKANEIHPS